MAETSEIKYFLSQEQVLNRLFVIYGNTTDCYRTAADSMLSFDRMLGSHLRFLGYEIVLFFRGGNVLDCYDSKMEENRAYRYPVEGAPSSVEAQNGTRSVEHGNNPHSLPGLGHLESRINVTAPSKTLSRGETTGGQGTSRVFIKAERIPSYLDRIMRGKKARSCIVFTNCWQIFEHDNDPCNQEIANYMSSWYSLPSENNNIAILLFNEPRLGSLGDFLRRRGS